MAEVGRAAVPAGGAPLPGGFWAAVAVWLERPQVANKRLCGVRLEARRRAARPWAQAPESGPGASPEPEEPDPAPRPRSPEAAPDPRPRAGPRQGAADDGPREAQDGRQPGEARDEAAAGPGRRGQAALGRDDFPAPDLDSLWDGLCRSLAAGHRELLAFLAGPGSDAGPQPEDQQELDVVLRTVIPKTTPQRPLTAPRREIVVQDVLRGTVTFLPLEEGAEGRLTAQMGNVYQIRLGRQEEEWFISVLIFCPEQWHSDGIVYPKPSWLGGELLARLARWAGEGRKSGCKGSLSLISMAKYSSTYQELKAKYKDLVKVWPEVTDPEKFVFEDVAIAAYLLVLWEEERAARALAARQSFVDLGCGNGLLVHILSSEGHPGRGIDVRRRKIWDMYGPQTRLEEGAVMPSDEARFPDADWLIGNHSDELTPWIPVIAARSSYSCRFFLLPCCFFDFVGRYRRRQSQKTQYREYLDFVREVGAACGFHVEEDGLRIPSTKRVCLIGKSRTYPPAAEAAADARRTQYISKRGCPGGPPGPVTVGGTHHPDSLHARRQSLHGAEAQEAQDAGLWLPGFRPREKAERVRNCTALPRDLTDRVVLQVAGLLLGQRPLDLSSPGGSTKTWNRGGSLSLAEVASKLDRGTLQRLKRECGGLQTLLRNSHQVFEVLNGRVRLRDWREEVRREAERPEAKQRLFSEAFKTRLCWFFTHHPDGCVLSALSCPFAHGPGELRPPRAPRKKQ
ncbi:probable tRNA (uracil-O(2)-)-methyltransferase [Talpa occidentalis]|uniref:probable tRNA (uracil-O(2)-)-methyltransferase n=1 Tax=Talpa occidentalis TaxID=50954 RepID=UPI00188EB9C6|nr:probable tRNA (uracil-O(2)-)-methyltransferase [Talpa occidentalis]